MEIHEMVVSMRRRGDNKNMFFVVFFFNFSKPKEVSFVDGLWVLKSCKRSRDTMGMWDLRVILCGITSKLDYFDYHIKYDLFARWS